MRPYAFEILVTLHKEFEIVIWSTCNKRHADLVLDYFDPDREFIAQRIYKDKCIHLGNLNIKDLRCIQNQDRKLKNIILVDTCASCFGFQTDNAVPIVNFTNEQTDQELKYLIPYLKSLKYVDPV